MLGQSTTAVLPRLAGLFAKAVLGFSECAARVDLMIRRTELHHALFLFGNPNKLPNLLTLDVPLPTSSTPPSRFSVFHAHMNHNEQNTQRDQ